MADPSPRRSVYRQQVRYLEADQQGVVFNMWYLGYFDEALAHHLDSGGLPYSDMLSLGFDVQLVRSEIDWSSPLRWPEEFEVAVGLDRRGRTSFDLRFEVTASGRPVASGRTVYVAVACDGSGPLPLPPALTAALGIGS